MNKEEEIKARGYEIVDEQPPFRIYEKHRKRIVYHVPSARIWNEVDLNLFRKFAKND